jgi:hypothetical protein
MAADPVSIALVVGTAASAGSSLMKGREQARAARFEQQQLEQQAQAARTAAAQTETKRRDELEASLGTIAALQGARGVGGPTVGVISRAVTQEKMDQMQTEKTNLLSKADLSQRASLMSGERADLAPWSGLLEATSTVSGSLLKYSSRKYGSSLTDSSVY